MHLLSFPLRHTAAALVERQQLVELLVVAAFAAIFAVELAAGLVRVHLGQRAALELLEVHLRVIELHRLTGALRRLLVADRL